MLNSYQSGMEMVSGCWLGAIRSRRRHARP
jgi:hypothetical protein